MKSTIQKIKDFWQAHSNRITLALSLIALVIFVVRGLYYVNHQAINMDEGTYLLKGRYYLEGTYRPYEIGGPVTNKGVFSFWILGLSQLIAPGILSGRLFALFLSTAMLIVMWLIIRRFSNQTWAAGILLLFAANGYWVSVCARALTQPVTSALIVFSVYFLTIKSAKAWHLTLGLVLGVVLSLTRQNLLPFYVFGIVFVVWQYGFKKAWFPIAVSAGLFLLVNAIYWPDMYRYMWRPMIRIAGEILDAVLPGTWQQVASSSASEMGEPAMAYGSNFVRQPWNIFYTVGIYIVPVSFALTFLICGNWAKASKSEHFKTFVFLYVSFIVLFLIHLMAVLNNNVLIFSFPMYPSFFLPLGLLIIPWSVAWMNTSDNLIRNILLSLTGVFISTGVGLALHRTYSDRLMFMTVPRVRNMHILPGTTELWRTLENKFRLGYDNLEYILATVYGFMVGVCIIIICYILYRILRNKDTKYTFALIFVTLTLSLCVLYSPSNYLSGFSSTTVCEDSPVQRMEVVSSSLAEIIPPGSLVYWEYHQPTLFLYLKDIRLFPLQLNNYFYKQVGGDPGVLNTSNLWNDEIAREWIQQADFVLLSENAAKVWEPRMNSDYYGMFDKLGETEDLNTCEDRSFLHVYKNLDPVK